MPNENMKTIDTLYLIDDDDTYQFIVQKTLNSLNLVNSIKLFSNGKAAIDFLEATFHDIKQIPDVILLDLSMPIMDGWQFLEQYLRFHPKIGKKVVIYVVSSSINPQEIQRAKSISEVTDYIVKPLTKSKLISLLQESLK
jgi:CheY-like chemotaxis protein